MMFVFQVQVIWQLLLNLCMFCLVVPGSSGFGERLSPEPYALVPLFEAQAPHSSFKPDLGVQPVTEARSSKSPPLLDKGSPPFPLPTKPDTPSLERGLATPPSTQTRYDASPPLSSRPPYDSVYPVAKPPIATELPRTPEVPLAASPTQVLTPEPPLEAPPFLATPPPRYKQAGEAPPFPPTPPRPSYASIPPPLNLPFPLESRTPPPSPSLAANPPRVLTSESPQEAPPFLPTPPLYEPPAPPRSSYASVPPPLTIPFPMDPQTPPPLLAANPPQVSTPETPIALPFLPAPPRYEGPQHAPIIQLSPMPLPVLSPPSQMIPSQVSPPKALAPSNAFLPPPLATPFPMDPQPPPSSSPPPSPNEPTIYEPPPPAGDAPLLKLSPPFVVLPSHAPSRLPGAEPPHASSLPLAANPPLLPVAEPPEALTLVPPPELLPVLPSPTPPMPLNESSPPNELAPPTVSSPLPQLAPGNASSPTASSFQPPPMFQNASSPPPLPSPSIASAPPPQLAPPNASSPPPQLAPLNVSPPVSPVMPHISPPNHALPPSSSFSPPLMVPPPTPPASVPQNASSLPPQRPPYASSPPPQVAPINASSPVPPLVSHMSPPALPPRFSFSPPLLVPPPVDSPPNLPTSPPPVPQNALSQRPRMSPPLASSPPPELVVPPPASPPPELVAPPPASPPTSVIPSIPFVSPPSMMPSPLSPSLSPPMPSQAPPPLPHPVPPYSFSPPLAEPPQVFSTPPPIRLPVTSPTSSRMPGAIPPRASASPVLLSPPHASPPQEKGSHASVSPPMTVPSRPLFAPPPSDLSYPSAPPQAVNGTVPALPPRSSQRIVVNHEASPPLLTSPETSPPSRAAPPFKRIKPESLPPIRQPVEAPQHSTPSSRLNVSDPQPPSLPAPAPSSKPDHSASPPVPPPDREAEQLSPIDTSPRHKPEFERQNGTAPAPSFVQVNPAVNGSHHSRHHSPGAPMAVAPLPSTDPRAPPPGNDEISILSPEIPPSGSSPRNTKRRLSPPLRSLPPPPPNGDCAFLTCPEPFTNTPPESPCGCVWPMQVGMRLSVPLYTFFPLVSELAQEIAGGVFLKPSQVRVMGANAAPQDPEKTIVLVDLVPLDEKFDNITSHLISDRFWNKQVIIDKSIFGDYEVLYVRYPGLPPSPPLAPADSAVINGMPYSVGDPNGSKLHPLGVDVTKQRRKHRVNAIIIAVIALAAVLGVLMCCSLAWILVFRHTNNNEQPTLTPRAVASLGRSSGPTGLSNRSGQSSLLSLGSSLATYTGSAKTFTGSEMEKATENFNPSRIIGEGGFGLVYRGDLEDETRVAVKVLKRDDQQGGREFLAEVEMLSRLHHRNLVKLIGICTDDRMRCLVYELIPNGSVDSHLHGPDKEIAPLDWASRMKIALGAARGLAYLHEDSSPRVIHRDFKSSNILLESDFNPKVSDFGLARSAMDEENAHISTRVMGTFGYVAPEYAMTGHLLVKSDVYSYGVVLLELLTGRKPVDMSQPAGQENLVSWTRPLLTSKEGLESIVDQSLGSEVPYESVAKVAAIASMCVQPEVSHRPFMGEVVQALKLVCSECDDSKDGNSRNHSHEKLSLDFDAKASSPGRRDPLQGQFSLSNYASGHDVEKGMSVSEIFSASASLGRQASDSFRRHSSSGPLRTRSRQFWQRIRGQSRGSVSEHGIMYKLWAGSH